MSGHSKWNNIKARKGKSDAERSKIFIDKKIRGGKTWITYFHT